MAINARDERHKAHLTVVRDGIRRELTAPVQDISPR
jgi:hypothetical protein